MEFIKNYWSVRVFILLLVNFYKGFTQISDDIVHHISPEDMQWLLKALDKIKVASSGHRNHQAPEFRRTEGKNIGDCLGLGYIGDVVELALDVIPGGSDKINTRFYFVSRKQTIRLEVFSNNPFSLKRLDFDASRRTILIVHGFMSHSEASWVTDMAMAFLEWDDVNVFLVDWSGGANTWKYWKAVHNTLNVGTDIANFFRQVMNTTGAQTKDFHFVGHSLGAHICAFAAQQLTGVSRITALDPAQPCYTATDNKKRLNKYDAEYVDVVHTNGRLITKIGFGIPETIGHADFYPNGGMQQPGCRNISDLPRSMKWVPSLTIKHVYLQLQAAVCNHGRAYLYFTESLRNKCSFRGYPWDLSYRGLFDSLQAACSGMPCAEMGIKAVGEDRTPKAYGTYFVPTKADTPYCLNKNERYKYNLEADLLSDLQDESNPLRNKQNYNYPYSHPMEPSEKIPLAASATIST